MAEPDIDGTLRYGMHETLREYSLDRLPDTAGLARLRRVHARYYADRIAPADSELKGRFQARWLHELGREHDNLRAALRWALDTGEVETGLQLGAALWRFWVYRGVLAEGDDWLTRGF
jgi:predicted ATPase